MSALAAVFDASGRDHRDAVTRMLDAASHRARGASRTRQCERAALGRRGRTDAASEPAFDPRTRNAIVFDGRLDNVDELSAALGVSPRLRDDELVLAAYERWREAAAAQLLGDFAFVIWDAAAGHLFAARDVFGQRPLFYSATRGIVAAASEPQQVLAHPLIPARINEAAVAEYLTGIPMTVGDTVWTDVARLPPAHALIVSDAGVRVMRYWQFHPEAQLTYPHDDDYARALAGVFHMAVRCRVRDALGGVGVFLSGGLDSSAVAAVAERLHREQATPVVRAYSLTYPDHPCDESPYIDAVVDQWSLPSTRLVAAAPTRAHVEAEVARYRDVPAFPNGSSLDALRACAASEVQVVLTGYGGDEWFTGSPLHATDLIREGRLVAAAQQLWVDGSRRGGGLARAALLRHVAAPLVPGMLKPLARAIAGTAPPAFEWIRPEFAARVALDDRLQRPPRPPFRTIVQQEVDAITSSALQVIGDELEERAAAFAGIEQRQPFTDRRVAAFGFALPDTQRRRHGETKAVMRRALADDLPEIVRCRRDKAEFSAIFVEAIDQLGGRRFFEHLHTADAGWVDPAVALAQHDRLTALYRDGDGAYIAMAGSLWAIAAVELWFRHTRGATS